MEDSYKILGLHVENVKKLKVVDITPDPKSSTVIIAGKNGNGKSSLLDSIEMVFRGQDAIPEKPIRKGEKSALIECNLGKLKIKRTFTEKGSYIFVETADGARYSSPQKMLDDLLGAITFDPLEFTRMNGKDQYETIRKMVKIKVDVDAIDREIKDAETERTFAGRQVKELAAQVKAIPEEAIDPRVDVSELIDKIAQAKANYAEYKAHGEVLIHSRRTIEHLQTELKNIQYQIEEEEKKITQTEARREEIVKTTPNTEQFKELEAKAANANVINQKWDQQAERGRRAELLKTWEEKHATLENTITTKRQEKADAIADAKMPIKGLSLEDGIVTYAGLPLAQASTAEQIRVSTAIAMAANPKLRVIRIKDGALMDDDSMAIIREMAEKKDFQVWIETVNSDDPMAIVIEDGSVAVKEEAA